MAAKKNSRDVQESRVNAEERLLDLLCPPFLIISASASSRRTSGSLLIRAGLPPAHREKLRPAACVKASLDERNVDSTP